MHPQVFTLSRIDLIPVPMEVASQTLDNLSSPSVQKLLPLPQPIKKAKTTQTKAMLTRQYQHLVHFFPVHYRMAAAITKVMYALLLHPLHPNGIARDKEKHLRTLLRQIQALLRYFIHLLQYLLFRPVFSLQDLTLSK